MSQTDAPNQGVLFEELEAARFTFAEMDLAYQDGIEDLADKVIELIYQSDYTITLEELVEFLEHEKEAP